VARKAPKTGDIVRSETLSTFGAGYVEKCEGIYIHIRWFALPPGAAAGHRWIARRDSVEIINESR
jgi:hypothetical protein